MEAVNEQASIIPAPPGGYTGGAKNSFSSYLSVMCNVLNHSIFLFKKNKKIQTSCLCSIMQHLPTHYNCGQFTEKTHLIKTVKSEYQSYSSSYWLMIYHNSNSIAHKMTNVTLSRILPEHPHVCVQSSLKVLYTPLIVPVVDTNYCTLRILRHKPQNDFC